MKAEFRIDQVKDIARIVETVNNFNIEEKEIEKIFAIYSVPCEEYGAFHFFKYKDGKYWAIVERHEVYSDDLDDVIKFMIDMLAEFQGKEIPDKLFIGKWGDGYMFSTDDNPSITICDESQFSKDMGYDEENIEEIKSLSLWDEANCCCPLSGNHWVRRIK